jgi:putative membrane protein
MTHESVSPTRVPADARHGRIRRVKSLLIKIVVNALAIWVATAVIEGITVGGSGTDKVVTYLIVGALFGLVNAFIKPVVKLFAFPLLVLSLGLFSFVINALMLQIVAWLSGNLNINFTIDSFFWTAILAAVVVTFVSMVLNLVLPDTD